MSFQIKICKEHSSEVEDFLLNNGTIFHSYAFLSTVGDEYQAIVIREDKSNNIAGVLPLVKTIKNRLKAFHIPPYAYKFGPVIDSTQAKYAGTIFKLMMENTPLTGHLDFSLNVFNDDLIPYIKAGFQITASQTHVFKRPMQENDIIKSIHHSKSRYIKKLIKLFDNDELKIIYGKECHEDLLKLQEETGKRGNFNPKLKKVKSIFDNLDEAQYYSLVIYHNGQALAGAFCPYDKNYAYHLINASIRHKDSLLDKANFLSAYLSLRKAFELDLDFDFEGSSIPAVADFYRTMGGIPTINYRAQKSKSLYYQILRFAQTVKKERI